eukprot:GCRY01001256.1.p1 GENE.GCRY01001256.1~~GCRY01001256.1.p1  ORF type:complete len:490 (+),score=81.77 GCRY01001256.1:95-1564(+)
MHRLPYCVSLTRRILYNSLLIPSRSSSILKTTCGFSRQYAFSKPFASVRNRFSHQEAFYSTTSSQSDYYEVIGVSRDAPLSDIKKAYYKKAKELHPDANQTDPKAQEKFILLGKAFNVLKDEKKRKIYDKYGAEAAEDENFNEFNPFQGGGAYGREPFSGGGGPLNIEDILRGFGAGGFGQQPGGNAFRPQKGADIQIPLRLSFMDAIQGLSRLLSYNTLVTCQSCSGSGSADVGGPTVCAQCDGTGVQTMAQGFFHMQVPCQHCGGAGRIITNPCKTCEGETVAHGHREVEVRIPPGVDSGTRVRVAGRGAAGLFGGPSGDLYVVFKIDTDEVFKREGTEIHVDVPLSVSLATLGGTTFVPTLTGDVELKVPPGTQPETTQIMRGRGAPHLTNPNRRGDQFVHFKVVIPRELSPRQRRVMETWRDVEQPTTEEPTYKGFFSRLKNAFSRDASRSETSKSEAADFKVEKPKDDNETTRPEAPTSASSGE